MRTSVMAEGTHSHRNVEESEILSNLNSPQPFPNHFGFCDCCQSSVALGGDEKWKQFQCSAHHKANVKCSPGHTSHFFRSSTKKILFKPTGTGFPVLSWVIRRFFIHTHIYIYIFLSSLPLPILLHLGFQFGWHRLTAQISGDQEITEVIT